MLEGKSIGSRRLKVADVIPRSFEKKNSSNVTLCQESVQNADDASAKENTSNDVPLKGDVDGETNGANLAADDSMSKTRSLPDVVTPLANMAYLDQLEHKKSSLMQILKRLVSYKCFYSAFCSSNFFKLFLLILFLTFIDNYVSEN